MKSLLALTAIAAFAGATLSIHAGAKEDVQGAAKKLAEKSNYSWKTTVNAANAGGGQGGNRMTPGPTEGKTEKGGVTHIKTTRGENTTEVVMKADKAVIKTADGWKTVAEATEGDPDNRQNPARAVGRMIQTFKAPAAQAEELAGKAKDLKKEGDAFVGELPEDAVKQLLSWGGRAGGEAPTIADAKGKAKFWVKDGLLAKYEYQVQGKMSFNGNDREIDRTTTTEITDAGTTKVEVPADATKKLSPAPAAK